MLSVAELSILLSANNCIDATLSSIKVYLTIKLSSKLSSGQNSDATKSNSV